MFVVFVQIVFLQSIQFPCQSRNIFESCGPKYCNYGWMQIIAQNWIRMCVETRFSINQWTVFENRPRVCKYACYSHTFNIKIHVCFQRNQGIERAANFMSLRRIQKMKCVSNKISVASKIWFRLKSMSKISVLDSRKLKTWFIYFSINFVDVQPMQVIVGHPNKC